MKGLILIGDSDPAVRRDLDRYLKLHGFTTCTAPDGVALIRTALDRRPDAILLERTLPAGDALTLLKSLCANDLLADTPVLVIADQDGRCFADAVLSAGASAFLPKPIRGQLLLDSLARLVGSRHALSELNGPTYPAGGNRSLHLSSARTPAPKISSLD